MLLVSVLETLVSGSVVETFTSGGSSDPQAFEFSVDTNNPSNFQQLELGFPDWIVYVGIAVILVIVTVIIIFLKKPKQLLKDEYEVYEEEDI